MFHAHLHVIPRKDGDGAGVGFHTRVTQDAQEHAALARRIAERLR